MTTSVIQPLESLRLARYAVPIPCYLCGSDNTFDAEYCTHCQAPMALAHQTDDEKTSPQMIAVAGASGAGKTVYLGMLIDMLSQLPERTQLLARGAFSITLQQTTVSALSQCEFPAKTPNEPDRWNWVHCQVRRPKQRKPLELVLPDMAGDALIEEVNHPHTFRIVRSFLKKCTGAMILVDAIQLQEGARDPDYFTMKLLSYMAELTEDSKSDWSQRPVALIFTKVDQCEECRDDPATFAKTHATRLWQHCRQRFGRHRFFASGVAGACAWRESLSDGRVQTPLRVEPHGIIEPFEWLLDNLPPKRV